jgi:ATP-dependent exoDNAse (exonuclease V) alpha subunit
MIVDEAGMVSGRQMRELLRLAEENGARVVLSGDTRQLQSVDASDALRILERESRLQSVPLTQVQRQTAREYREAIEELRRNPARGFNHLERMGAVMEVAWADRARTVAEAWRHAHSHMNAHGEQSSVLVVCATHQDIGEVTAAIRAERQRVGELGEAARVERYEPLHYTMAQKSDVRNVRAGQVLVFHRATNDIDRHEALDVVRADGQRLIGRTEAGVERVVTGKEAHAFDVYERRPIEIAPNDRVLLMANRREAGFRATNGDMVTVARVDEQGRLHWKDGRMLPANYKQFNHGYAVTAHRSQGKSVDAVVIVGEAVRRELFYVAASRGRERVTVVTSDKALLQESIGRSGDRQGERSRRVVGGFRGARRHDVAGAGARRHVPACARPAGLGRRGTPSRGRVVKRHRPAVDTAGHHADAHAAPRAGAVNARRPRGTRGRSGAKGMRRALTALSAVPESKA